MAKDGSNRGGARAGAGRKPKAAKEKITEGRKTKVLDFADAPVLQGVEMPPPHEFMKEQQRDGSVLQAEEIYKNTWSWLAERGCDKAVSPQLIEQYAMSVARWIHCEEALSKMGYLAKHPTTGAIVDLAYAKTDCPKIAAEVLLGHGVCHIIADTSVHIPRREIRTAVRRIAGKMRVDYAEVPQDALLAENQSDGLHCGDNGIFKGVPLTGEQKTLALIAKEIYTSCPYDGKYILDGQNLTICQSNAETRRLRLMHPEAVINPLGDWTGGPDVDAGATNRKLGSDMADSVTGGGLHGKDLSKADVSVNIYAFLKAQETGEPVELCCAIGDDTVDGRPYAEIVEIAQKYISSVGGFERFAEWGLVR